MIDDNPFESGVKLGKIGAGRLWAPWRMKYIQAAANGEEEPCFLCENPKCEDCAENLVLYRGEHCFIIMNLYPYNNGHLMVAPYRHEHNFLNLNDGELMETQKLIQLCIKALDMTMYPHGYNVGWNFGRAAGAGIEEHLHQHVVPRWNGDTNFMPVVASTKVVSESLYEGWNRLKEAFDKLRNQ